jgi:hypothetical protein
MGSGKVLLDAANARMLVPFALMLRGWTRDLVVFKTEAFDVAPDPSAQLQQAGVRVEAAPVRRLIGRGRSLESVELSTGDRVPRAGDLTTRGQAAIFASSASVLAATMINLELNSELALSGAL